MPHAVAAVAFGFSIDEWGLGSLIAGGLGLVVVAYLALFLVLCWLSPRWAVRILLWLPSRMLYRFRVIGRENIPVAGAALFVCNHVSWVDALMVFLAQRREIRFLMWAPLTKAPGLGFFLKLARVIPIDGSAGPRSVLQSLRVASEALRNGELVCIFAEGSITRTGLLLPFQRGFEQIVKRTEAPIIPVCLDHVWGSIFSYQGGKLFWKWPQKLPYPVTVAFGKPLPSTAGAIEVRQEIQKLSADCALARSPVRPLVHRQFLRMAARHPFRRCVIDANNNGKTYNYASVAVAAKVLGDLLRPRLRDEEMIGIWLPTSLGGTFTNIALAFLGKTTVNLNYTSSKESLHSAVKQCGLRTVITARAFLEKMPIPDLLGVQLIHLEDLRAQVSAPRKLATFLAVLTLPYFLLDRLVFRLGGHKPGDLATVIFSSGSTGDPKGIMLTHANLAANAESTIQAIDPRPSDMVVGVLPFFHSFGYTVTLWVPLQVGASSLYYPDPRQAKEIGELCRRFGGTIFLTTPTLLRYCFKRCETTDFQTLRLLMVGAEKMPLGLAREFKAKFGVLPMEGYGCTELSPVACVNVPDYEQGDSKQIGNKPGTIGQPIPGVAARIVHPETFEPLPVGQEGMLLIYGGNVMKGYLGKPEVTKEAIRDGWYVTGDIARYDEDGFLTITDRMARFSKIAGEMVPHQKIEDELHDLLGAAERHCIVTSVPDERRGEKLFVLHLPMPSANPRQLCQKLVERGIPKLWAPDERDFLQITELPMLGSGKIDLKRAREMALQAVRGNVA